MTDKKSTKQRGKMRIVKKLAVATSFLKEDRFEIDKKDDKRTPEFLHFNRERDMPIVSVAGVDGYMMFPSPQSFDRFRNEGSKTEFLLTDAEGVGFPLFHIVRENVMERWSPTPTPILYRIYAYEIRASDSVPPYGSYEVVSKNHHFKLYRRLYCSVSRFDSGGLSQYKMVFENRELEQQKSIYMVHKHDFRDLDTKVLNTGFRWHVKYSPVITNDHYRLMYMNPQTVSLLDTSEEKAAKKGNEATGKSRYEAVIGHYSTERGDLIPKKTVKCADFIVGEQGSPDSLGLVNVPLLTKVFACQSLLIHCIEAFKRRGTSANTIFAYDGLMKSPLDSSWAM